MDKIKEVRFLVCVPWKTIPLLVRDRQGALKRECFVCHGNIAINPLTFEKDVPKDCLPVCGACALDLVDGGETLNCQLTDSQQREPVLRAITAMKDWSQMVMEHIREYKSEYDARPNERKEGQHEGNN
jgi:hypothetical protein